MYPSPISDRFSRLDHATKLVREDRRLWLLRLYPEAAEAGGAWVWVGRGVVPRRGPVSDSARARDEADRRARGKLRRYVTANRLSRLVSLTYSGDGLHDPVVLRAHVSSFVRRLRRDLGGEAFAYAWVPEWHSSGHGLHVHMALGRYVAKPVAAEAWGHGFVDIRLIRGGQAGNAIEAGPRATVGGRSAPSGGAHRMGGLREARVAAGYIAKYLGKGLDDDDRHGGLHRYEVAQGFQPQSVEIAGRSKGEALLQADSYMDALGFDLSRVWESENEPEWQGPPAIWASWNER